MQNIKEIKEEVKVVEEILRDDVEPNNIILASPSRIKQSLQCQSIPISMVACGCYNKEGIRLDLNSKYGRYIKI